MSDESVDIDGIWSKIEDGYVAYQSEIKKWMLEKRGPPACPVCNNTRAGMVKVRTEGKMKIGECKNCGAKLTILLEK